MDKTEIITGVKNPIFFQQLCIQDQFSYLTSNIILQNGGVKKRSDLQKYELKLSLIDTAYKNPVLLGETPLYFDEIIEEG